MMKNTKLLFSALVSAATLSCAPALFSAADLTWNGTKDNNSWDYYPRNWLDSYGNSTSFSTDDNVTFGPNAEDKTVVVDDAVYAGTIIVSGAYTYTGGSVYANSLTVVGDRGALTLSNEYVELLNGLTVGAGSTLTLDDSAWVVVGSPTAQKGLVVAGTISGGGRLNLYLTDDADNKIHLGAGNGFTGTVEVSSGSFSLSDSDIGSGTYFIDENVTMRSSKDTTVSNNIELWNDTKTLTVDSGTTLTLSGKLYGVGGMDKQGAGTLVLRGENTYKGGTTVSAGTVVAANASALGTGRVDVGAEGTLQFTGTFAVGNTITGAGTVEIAGESTDVLTFSGDASAHTGTTLISGGTFSVTETAKLGTGTVTISGGHLSVANGVTLNTDTISIVLNDADAYLTTAAIDGSGSLAAETTITLSLDDALAKEILASGTKLEFQILGGDLAENSSGITVDYSSFDNLDKEFKESYTWHYEAGVLTIAALPEPSAFGLLAGLGALALVAARRRRGRKAA